MSQVKSVPIKRLESGQVESVEDSVVVERPVSITVDGVLRVETVCSPGELGEWVIGYLLSEGLIGDPEDVDEVTHDGDAYNVQCRSVTEVSLLQSVESDFTYVASRVLDAAAEVVSRATIFHETGGTHVMAIADQTGMRALVEDISRTCALEKAIGQAVLKGVEFGQALALLSSRVPARMIRKLARCGVPIVAAVSAPTADAVELAEELNICLCGFVRGERLNVYSHGWRIGL